MNLYKSVALALVTAGITAGCSSKMLKSPEKVSYSTEPQVLELQGDSIRFTMNLQFGPKFFDKRGVLEATPVLNYSGNSVELPAAKFKGESVTEGGGRTVNFENGGKFSQSGSIAYKKGMETAELNAKVKVGVKKKTVDFPDVKLADGTIITQSLLNQDYRPAMAPSLWKEVQVEKAATIYFVINRFDIRDSEKKKDELQKLVNFMQSGYDVRQIVVNGFASPDGELQFNDKLADQRAKAANDFVFNALYGKKGMKKNKEKLFDDNFYQEQTGTEDWKGLLSAIQNATDIPEKDQVIKIINGGGSSEEKQAELRKLTKSYQVLADKYLPPLRRANMVVKAVEPVKSDSMLLVYAKSKPDTLSANEFVKAAGVAKTDADRKAIYEQMAKSHPADYRSFNNMGVMALQSGDKAGAVAMFDKAKAANANAGEVLNNLAIIAAMDGDHKKAKDLFTQAGNAGIKADYNLGVCAIRMGDWNVASSKLASEAGNYNKALAFVLVKNYSAAEKETETIENKDAAVYYLRAIIGARTENRDMMTTGLTRAIAADAKYRDMAKKDAEFIKHWNQDYFKVAIR
jgi:outer membrane protein OmpA-like peptidoglycan-associated protein/Flp pilus assembly protein TadD